MSNVSSQVQLKEAKYSPSSLNILIDSLCTPYTTQFQKLSTMLDLASSVNMLREARELDSLSVNEIVQRVESISSKEKLHIVISEMLSNKSHTMYNKLTK